MIRSKGSWSLALAMVLAATALVVAPGVSSTPKKGGVLRVATIGEAPTLDAHVTTATITREIGINIFETLFTLDAKYQPVPLLVEGYDVQDGGKRYVLRLRKNVKFHNGKDLTAADVVASLNRWGAMSSVGKAVYKIVSEVSARNPSTVEITLKEPSGTLLMNLAQVDNAAVIYPKEVIDASAGAQLKEYIGTGPFKFVEHKPDRHLKLARFDGYVPRAEPANGLGGQRIAYLNEIYFMPVPDISIRLAGITSGDYGYAALLKQDQYERLKSSPGVEPVVVKPYGWITIVLNTKQGVMADKRLRQAVQAALDIEPMMLAAMGHKDFFRLDPSILFQEQALHSKAGAALYNQHDKDKARKLLKEAGYAGQPVRWIVTNEYEHHYKTALVGKSQLEDAGLKIDLQVSDWATVVQRRNKPEAWDAFSTAFIFGAEPSTWAPVACDWPGWWCNPEKEQLLAAMSRETDAKRRAATWDKVQTLFYADAARIRLGDYFRLDARRKDVQGFENGPYQHLWNVWLDR